MSNKVSDSENNEDKKNKLDSKPEKETQTIHLNNNNNNELQQVKKFKMINFASSSAGAIILDKSPSTAKGFSSLLDDDMDRYGISPCKEDKWVVIGLSEDILVSSIAIANYEKYSSLLKDFEVLAITSYPTEEWIRLGEYIYLHLYLIYTLNILYASTMIMLAYINISHNYTLLFTIQITHTCYYICHCMYR